MADIDYQDFAVYALENDGTYNELEIEEDNLEEILHEEEVFLVVKQELRRLFIWKGPKSPVRKRFISSRVASKMQEQVRKDSGRHLKIVSVDAGDETIEFLSAFNLQPFEATGQLEDMRYIRNAEKEKQKQEEYKKQLEARKKQQQKGYQSPLLAEMSDEDKEKLKSQMDIADTSAQPSVATTMANQAGLGSRRPSTSRPASVRKKAPSSRKRSRITKAKVDKIINEVTEQDPPDGLKRMNIIIQKDLYAPSVTKSIVLGKEVEKVGWSKVKELPEGHVVLDMKKIRIYIDDEFNEIKAIELFDKDTGNENEKSKKKGKSESKKSSSGKKGNKKDKEKQDRKLPDIPTG